MRCSHVRKLLSPYIDGELSEKKTEKIRDHVSHCTLCGEELQALQNLDTLSRETFAHEPSEAYWANFLPRLHRRIETAPPQSNWEKTYNALRNIFYPSSTWLKTAGAVASVVLIFFVGRAVIQHKGTDTLVTPLGEKRLREKIEHAADAVQEKEEKKQAVSEEIEEIVPSDEIAKSEPGLELEGITEEPPPPKAQESKETKAPPPVTQDRGTGQVSLSPTAPKEADEELKTYIETQKPSKKMYSIAERDESQQAYEQALRTQKLGEKESASTQFQDIVENYPKSRVADDAQFQLNLAQRSLTIESPTLDGWQQQRYAWQNFLDTYQQSELVNEACLRLAESWYHIATITLSEEHITQALEVNRSCLTKRDGESTLKKQIQDLEKALKEHTE